MSIRAVNVSKRYGKHRAVSEVDVTIERGELVALLGPSGSGKTTLLRLLAGLELPDEGRVLFNDRDVTRGGVNERGVGFVFQHYALFREMNVFENIAFGLRVMARGRRPAETEVRRRVHELLGLIHLEGMADRYPAELSGGQRQRVALARALAIEPEVMLLDEPFGALDAQVRRQLRSFLCDLHQRIGVTTVLVTHDRDEALEVADRIVLMRDGRVLQAGTPTELHDAPHNAFVETFFSDVNVFQGRVDEQRVLRVGALRIAGASRLEIGATRQVTIPSGGFALFDDSHGANATVVRTSDLGDRGLLQATIDDGPAVRANVERSALAMLVRGARVRLEARVFRAYNDDGTTDGEPLDRESLEDARVVESSPPEEGQSSGRVASIK